MEGFEQALNEYERKLTSPFDHDEEEGLTREEYMEMVADRQIEEMLLEKGEE